MKNRCALLAVMYGWFQAGDNQLLYRKTPPELVFSVDHGHFFPGGPEWTVEGGATRLEAHFAPSRRAQRLLLAASIALTLLVAASAWTILSPQEDAAIGFLVPLLTALAIFAFPLVAVALGSHREAEEAGIRRAIRKALLDEDDRFPAPQRWDDED